MEQKEKTLENIVLEVMKENKETRSNNNLLYLEVLKKFNLYAGNFSIDFILTHGEETFGFPKFSTVMRIGRRIKTEYKI